MLMFYIASRFRCIKNNGLGSVGLFATALIDRLLWNRYSFPPWALALPLLSLLQPFGGVVGWTITVVAYLPFVAGRALSRLCSPSLFGCSVSALVFGRHDDGVNKLNLLCQFFSSHLVCGPPPLTCKIPLIVLALAAVLLQLTAMVSWCSLGIKFVGSPLTCLPSLPSPPSFH
jgi:hypothetical protein